MPRVLLVVFLLALAAPVAAQFTTSYPVTYRPGDVRYRVFKTPHFDIIYDTDVEAEAREAAAYLEGAYAVAKAAVGLRTDFRMPVVFNGFNDVSNGYVSPYPFRQEIEATPIKGKSLAARDRSWLETVTTHELVHAANAQVAAPFGVGGIVGLLGRDISRVINFIAPSGMLEGAAVLVESAEEGGRLNHPFFEMQFRANMDEDRWSLARTLEPSAFSFPTGRHYVGGSHFALFLTETYGPETFARATRFFNAWPFLGYGAALWHATGQTPGDLSRAFRNWANTRHLAFEQILGEITEPQALSAHEGWRHRRPKWLDDQTLVTYLDGYNVRPGFYRVDVQTGRLRAIAHHRITEDYFYSLSLDRTQLFYSRYQPDPLVTIRQVADLHTLDLTTGNGERISRSARLYSPVQLADGTRYALQIEGAFSNWMRVTEEGPVPMETWERSVFREMAPSPDGQRLVVLANVRGQQGLFEMERRNGHFVGMQPLVLFADASVYDPAWSDDGRYLLFTADRGGVMNIYALDTQADRILKLTNVRYGAMEPSLSPDGRTLAFVNYRAEQYDLALVPFDPARAEQIPRAEAQARLVAPITEALADPPVAPVMAESQPYQPLAYLRPRILYPIVDREGREGASLITKGWKFGLGFSGTDVLESFSYNASGFWQMERLWGEATLQTTLTPLRSYVRAFNTPGSSVVLRVPVLDQQGNELDRFDVQAVYENRGIAIGGGMPIWLQRDVRTSYVSFNLEGRLQESRFVGEDGKAIDEIGQVTVNGQPRAVRLNNAFRRRATVYPSLVAGWGLQRNLRDFEYNSGLLLRTAGEFDVDADEGLAKRQQLYALLDVYLPVWLRKHHTLNVQAGVLTQNVSSSADFFLPRGYEGDLLLRARNIEAPYLRASGEYVLPLAYVDNGWILLPAYLSGIYLYGFGDGLFDLEQNTSLWSVGAGLGVHLRLWHALGLSLRIGAAYRSDGKFVEVLGR